MDLNLGKLDFLQLPIIYNFALDFASNFVIYFNYSSFQKIDDVEIRKLLYP